MTCRHCGSDNPSGKRFCGDCGAVLENRCPQCGADNPANKKFCGDCGAALVAQSPRVVKKAEARKVVTIGFADLIGSTALHERLDAESARRLMDRYYRALRAAVESHGGTVVKLLGDGVMAAFGVPRVAEDDAIRAVRAAVGMQEAFRQLALTPNPSPKVGEGNQSIPPIPSWERGSEGEGALGLRIAVNTGEVVVSADNTDVVGDPVNVAARLQQEARDGEVLIGESTRRLVSELVTLEPAGIFTLKGRSESVAAYRVVSLERPAGAAATAFVGRDEELRRITAVYDGAVAERRARLAVILGSPGLGKSRLLDEFGRRLGDRATVLSARCEATGGSTFAPIAEALRESLLQAAQAPPTPAQGVALGSGLAAPSGLRSGQSGEDQQPQRGDQPIARGNAPGGGGATEDLRAALVAVLSTDADSARIAAGITALLAGTPAPPEETFFVVRRFLAALAATQPVVLAIDDLQWAEPLLLDLVEHLVQWGTGIPLLVLAAARPDLREVRSSLARAGELVSDVVTLAGLDAAAATRLAANVIRADALPAAVAGRVLATSEGNPLFVGELVRMLVADGVLKQEGDRWTAGIDLADLSMPPTIHALLAARIERLEAEDRTLLERAAVIGRQFSRAAVADLLPAELRAHLDARLEALRRSELIEPDTGWFLGEPALRFHHRLTRDAAYRRVLKGTRAELHARCADWIEGKVGDAIEHQETIGWHLEQAHQYARELGPIDSRGQAIGSRAAQYLGGAGRRALARDDVSVAADLLGRAVHVLNEADRGRADLALDWCEALLASGDVAHARGAIDELGRWIDDEMAASGSLPLKKGGQEGFVDGASDRIPLSPPFSKGEGDRLRAWHTCFAGRLAVLTDPQALHATATAVAAAADELAAVGDAAGEANAHLVHALALQRLGKIGASEAALDKALAAARRGHDRRRANTVLANAPLAALWGPSPVTRASGRCLDVVRVLRITQGAPAVEAVALRCQAVLEALRGRSDAARRMIASSRRMVEELGITQGLLETEHFAGLIALIEGDTAAAEQSLRAAYDGLRHHGLGIDAARAAALLGITLLAQGRAADAKALSHESEALAGDDLQAAITWRRVRAGALVQRGEYAAAVDFARAAVDIAAATDNLIHHADARLALAAALRAAGCHDEAVVEQARAVELWDAKGATVLAERARDTFGRAEAVERAVDDRAARVRPVRRRVEANAATAIAVRLDAAIAARDDDALSTLFPDESEALDHTTGSTLDGGGLVRSWRYLLRAEAPTCRHEPLATLGNSLALVRQSVSASGFSGGTFDVGAYSKDIIGLLEVDAQGPPHSEWFPNDRLSAAVARLYERYAELLPAGPARTRATATARSVAALLGPIELDRLAAWHAPAIEVADHRILGTWSARGAEAALQNWRSLLDLADSTIRFDDILGLRPDALLCLTAYFGAHRAWGGVWEERMLTLWAFGADGRWTRVEVFDVNGEPEALARFDELTGESTERPLDRSKVPLLTREGSGEVRQSGVNNRPLTPSSARRGDQRPHAGSVTRRVRPNAATANAARMDAAIAARDVDAIADLYAPDAERTEHQYGDHTIDRQGAIFSYRSMLNAQDLTCRHEPLATLGDALALYRVSVWAGGYAGRKLDVGVYDIEVFGLFEVDTNGRRRREEFFATHQFGDSIIRLYERYAELLPEGPPRARAAATARSVALMMTGPADLDRSAALAPAIEQVDHRILGTWSGRGPEEFLWHWRSFLHLAEDVVMREDDILDLRSDALLLRRTHLGTDRSGGGAYERQFLVLLTFGTDGLVTRSELFDSDREAEALARFDALTATGFPLPVGEGQGEGSRYELPGQDRPHPSPLPGGEGAERTPRIENVATRRVDRFLSAWAARDWEGIAATFAPGFRLTDRRSYAHLDLDRDQHLEYLRCRFEMPSSFTTSEVLATRGQRLALTRSHFTLADRDVGPSESESLAVSETDEHGDCVALVMFDPDALDAAYAELDDRYAAGEGAPYATLLAKLRAVGTGDQDALASSLADGFRFVSHRRFFAGTAWSRDEFLAYLRTGMGDVDVRNRVRIDHVPRLSATAGVSVLALYGTVGGGDFEIPIVNVFTHDGSRLHTMETFDLDQLDAALARYEELSAGAKRTPRIENAATRGLDRFADAWATHDWERIALRFAPGLRLSDRRSHAHLDLDRDQHLASLRFVFGMCSSRYTHEVLATRGHRLVLARLHLELADRDIGPSETESLAVSETDEHGDCVALVMFDPDDLDAAYAELDNRYAAGEAAPYARAWETLLRFERATAARDWEQWVSAFAPDYVVDDHRRLGWGTLHSREEYMAYVRALVDLAPDVTTRLDHVLALDDRRIFHIRRWVGSREGGPFEMPLVAVSALGPDGRIQRSDIYDPDQLDEARARFEAIGGPGTIPRPESFQHSRGQSADGHSLDTPPEKTRPTRAERPTRSQTNIQPFTPSSRPPLAAYRGAPASPTPSSRRTGGATSDPLGALAKPNAATVAMDRVQLAFAARHWAALRALCAADVKFEDRRGETPVSGDAESWIADMQEIAQARPDARCERQLVLTAGDRVDLERIFVGGEPREYLWLTEVDERGAISAAIAFDAGDWRAAHREAFGLWYARDAVAAAVLGPAVEGVEGWNDRDRDRMRAAVSEHIVQHDHRLTGAGRTDGADAVLDDGAAMWDLAPDVQIEPRFVLALDRHGVVVVMRYFGTLPEGGPWEAYIVYVAAVARGRITRLELFELEHVDAALARFEELRGGAS